jgi:anti-sigma factor RsiW
VKPWFLGKLDYAPPVQDLAAMGFPLDGGRLAKIDGRTVAVLVYQRRLHPITVFVWPEGDAPSAAAGARNLRGFNVRHWTSGGMAFWAVTDANPSDLEELAKALSR